MGRVSKTREAVLLGVLAGHLADAEPSVPCSFGGTVAFLRLDGTEAQLPKSLKPDQKVKGKRFIQNIIGEVRMLKISG